MRNPIKAIFPVILLLPGQPLSSATQARKMLPSTALIYQQTKQVPIDFTELDKLALEELKQRNTPGAAVAVIKDGRLIHAKGYGVASIETGSPVTPEMLFRLGSTTKMLTAAALVTLAAAGKLKLDAPIENYVKGLNPQLARVTAHQLLSHSTGLRDFAASVTSNDDAALGNQARLWKEDVFFTEPGKIFSYSSPGYWLAGLVIEEVYGKPYADAMDELLFKPLGMNRSTLRPSVAMTYPLTAGHCSENRQGAISQVIRPAFNNTAMWPGGSVYSNIGDLARFVIALLESGRLDDKQALDPLVVAKLPAPHVTMPGSTDVHYGYGLMSYNYRGVHVVTHGGACPRTWEVFIKEGKLWLKHEGNEAELKRIGPVTFSYGQADQLAFALDPDGRAEHLFLGLYAAKKVRSEK